MMALTKTYRLEREEKWS